MIVFRQPCRSLVFFFTKKTTKRKMVNMFLNVGLLSQLRFCTERAMMNIKLLSLTAEKSVLKYQNRR